MNGRPGRPSNAEVAHELRLARGLSQAEAAKSFGCSQSFISRLENNLAPSDEVKRYLEYLRNRNSRRVRHAGGGTRIGPKRVRPIDPKKFRGAALFSDSDIRSVIRGWELIGSTRASSTTELVFAFHAGSDQYALIAVRRKNGLIVADDPIAFDQKYENSVTGALEAFGAGRYPSPAL